MNHTCLLCSFKVVGKQSLFGLYYKIIYLIINVPFKNLNSPFTSKDKIQHTSNYFLFAVVSPQNDSGLSLHVKTTTYSSCHFVSTQSRVKQYLTIA